MQLLQAQITVQLPCPWSSCSYMQRYICELPTPSELSAGWSPGNFLTKGGDRPPADRAVLPCSEQGSWVAKGEQTLHFHLLPPHRSHPERGVSEFIPKSVRYQTQTFPFKKAAWFWNNFNIHAPLQLFQSHHNLLQYPQILWDQVNFCHHAGEHQLWIFNPLLPKTQTI